MVVVRPQWMSFASFGYLCAVYLVSIFPILFVQLMVKNDVQLYTF